MNICFDHLNGIRISETNSPIISDPTIIPNWNWDQPRDYIFHLSTWLKLPPIKSSEDRTIIGKWQTESDRYLWKLYIPATSSVLHFAYLKKGIINPTIQDYSLDFEFLDQNFQIDIFLGSTTENECYIMAQINGLTIWGVISSDPALIPSYDELGPLIIFGNTPSDSTANMNGFIEKLLITTNESTDILNSNYDFVLQDIYEIDECVHYLYYFSNIENNTIENLGSLDTKLYVTGNINYETGRILVPCTGSHYTSLKQLYGHGFPIVSQTTRRELPGLGFRILEQEPKKIIVFKMDNENIEKVDYLQPQKIINNNRWAFIYCFGEYGPGLYVVTIKYDNYKEIFYIVVEN